MNTVTPHTFAFDTFIKLHSRDPTFFKGVNERIFKHHYAGEFLLSVEGSEVWKI